MSDGLNSLAARFLFGRFGLFFAPMLRTLRKAEYAELNLLFFIMAAAMGIWLVPLGTVLDAHGMRAIKPFAFAASALAAFVSPLVFGAMADRRFPPVLVLRGLALAAAATMALVGAAIQSGLNAWLVLALIQLYSLCAAPMWSIGSTIVFARLADAKREFGAVRAMATLGWMAGCWLVSVLNADASSLAVCIGAAVWLLVAAFTFFLPVLEMPPAVLSSMFLGMPLMVTGTSMRGPCGAGTRSMEVICFSRPHSSAKPAVRPGWPKIRMGQDAFCS